MQTELNEIETDYLVIGAGAGGMAFTDELLRHTDATITIVDRRHAPGGHWVDAYPFVRLHQPSAFYGVTSVPLGQSTVDKMGTNAGFYELAGVDEIRGYYERVMHDHFLPSGRVRYFPCCEYVGDGRFVSRLTGASTKARVDRKLVDATYMEGEIPATSPPPFEVAEGVRCIPAGQLARLVEPAERYVIVGGGKTSLDVCVWLLERGVSASSIRWIRPRESWWINRKFQQPESLAPDLYLGSALQLEAMAEASSIDDLFERLEAHGFFLRIDPSLTPTMFRGAIISEGELELLRRVEDVVRLGKVQRIGADEIILDSGRVETSKRTLHIHCAASALAKPPPRPIFEADRVTMQPFMWGFACYQFAALAVVEATIEGDEEKNRLVPPVEYWDVNENYASAFLAAMRFEQERKAHTALSSWVKTTRLSPVSQLAPHFDDPRMLEIRERIKRVGALGVGNLQKLLFNQ